MTASLYVLELLYHGFVLHTISSRMERQDIFRLVLGFLVTFGGTALARYWINRRDVQRRQYEHVFTELETAGKQNAVFLSNVSRELRTPINMVIGISEVALGKELPPDIRADMSSIKMAGKRLSNQINNLLDYTEIVIPQGVADEQPCIVLNHADQFCIACYFRPEKYSCDEVREYYDGLIYNLVEGLGIKGYQAHKFEGFLKLVRSHTLTHVFIAQSEYEENRRYYEELAETLRVVIIAEREFVLNSGSKLFIIHKPFSALSVANLLNGEMGDRRFAEAQAAGRKPFTCVGVRALAVDDEEMNLVVTKGVLGSYGIEVDTCLSGREAVAQCGSVSYDIMPGGAEAA